MIWNRFFLLVSLVFLIACSTQKSSAQYDNLIKDFYKEQGLDKRTTYTDVMISGSKKSLSVSGIIQGYQVKEDFYHFLENAGYQIKDDLDTLRITEWGVARNSVSNLRTEPRHGAELSSQYLMGQKLSVIKREGEWILVQGPDKYLGWLDEGGFLSSKDISSEWTSAEKRIVQKNESVVYKSSADKDEEVSDVVFGNILGLLSNQDQNVVLPDGRKGHVDKKIFDKLFVAESPVEIAIERGYSLLGRPYLWGGTSPKAMDCSGFTRTCFYSADYLLGRDASLQVHEGEVVPKDDRSQWKRGDLLFFGNFREDGSMRITHVAIHLGDGRLIHSASRVRIESLNPKDADYNAHRDETLMAVRRIF